VAKTHLIKENELGLLPTPNCTRINIPTIEEVNKRKEIYGGKTRGMYLTHTIAMGLLPTPTLQEYTNSTLPPSQIKRSNLAGVLLREGILAGSHLNPQFVEEMMGFPERWTELPFLNGKTNH
jgi:hypothetical protein